MSTLEQFDALPENSNINTFIHPELWPGWRKLPWAASAIAGQSVKVYIPENRKVEKWLQDLIDMPNHMLAKIGDVTPKDWSTEECPSELIVQRLQKAEERWMEACKKAKTMEGQDKSAEHGLDEYKD